jgi:CDP-diacylglycerol--glycerol-3-phosphate 3-phosphatidyltransferase
MLNIPNSITIFRILLVPVFVLVLSPKIAYGNYLATAIFVIAALTDSLDGYLARKWKQVTKLGIILDPLADKLLITAALISLVELQVMPGWVAITIIGREFAVSGLRTVKAETGIIIPASKMGKIKTITQVVAVTWLLLENVIPFLDALNLGIKVMYVALAITIISGIKYFGDYY